MYFKFVRKDQITKQILGLKSHTMAAKTDIKTFVFVDLETTGIPFMEHNKTKITELCMVSVQSDHIRLGVFPRVQNKLSFCFNPCKLISPGASNITGLNNFLLEAQKTFSKETVDLINSFLRQNQKPLCLVAHNGNFFDYPILRRQIELTGSSLEEDLLCIDSLQLFRELDTREEPPVKQVKLNDEDDDPLRISDEMLNSIAEKFENEFLSKMENARKINETTPQKQKITNENSPSKSARKLEFLPGFKLTDLYLRYTNKSSIKEHEAEGDVNMLITCAAVKGDDFVDWANLNSKRFSDIPMMTPGKKIGT